MPFWFTKALDLLLRRPAVDWRTSNQCPAVDSWASAAQKRAELSQQLLAFESVVV